MFIQPDIIRSEGVGASTSIFCQSTGSELALAARLAQLADTNFTVSHFASLYGQTTIAAMHFFATETPATRQFIQKLEWRFAGYFFEAVDNAGKQPDHWRTYFRYKNLTPVQYHLLGANAHINGDIWRSMTSLFTAEEIRRETDAFLRYSSALQPVFNNLYDAALQSSAALRLLHRASFGACRSYGFRMLKRWRRRQLELAMLYHSHPRLFRIRYWWLRQNMQWLNLLVLKML